MFCMHGTNAPNTIPNQTSFFQYSCVSHEVRVVQSVKVPVWLIVTRQWCMLVEMRRDSDVAILESFCNIILQPTFFTLAQDSIDGFVATLLCFSLVYTQWKALPHLFAIAFISSFPINYIVVEASSLPTFGVLILIPIRTRPRQYCVWNICIYLSHSCIDIWCPLSRSTLLITIVVG